MSGAVYVVRTGSSERLDRLLRCALEGRDVYPVTVDALVNGLADARILFAVAVDTLGVDEAFVRLLRILRSGELCKKFFPQLCNLVVHRIYPFNFLSK